MGRPTLGQAARTVSASTKISAAQAEQLKARHGTVYRGVAAAIGAYLADQPEASPQAAPPPEPASLTGVADPPRRHLHRRVKGPVAGYHQGTPQFTWTCAEDGCDWSEIG